MKFTEAQPAMKSFMISRARNHANWRDRAPENVRKHESRQKSRHRVGIISPLLILFHLPKGPLSHLNALIMNALLFCFILPFAQSSGNSGQLPTSGNPWKAFQNGGDRR